MHWTSAGPTSCASARALPNRQAGVASSLGGWNETSTEPPPLAKPREGTRAVKSRARNSKGSAPADTSCPLFETESATSPSPRAGARQTTTVEETRRARTAISRPNRHASSAVPAKCAPKTVTACPDRPSRAREGMTAASTGPGANSYAGPPIENEAPPSTETSTVSVPRIDTGGDVQCASEDETSVGLVPMRLPKRHASGSARFSPTTATRVPPAVAPCEGCSASTTGAWCASYLSSLSSATRTPACVRPNACAPAVSTGAAQTSASSETRSAFTAMSPKRQELSTSVFPIPTPATVTWVPPETGAREG